MEQLLKLSLRTLRITDQLPNVVDRVLAVRLAIRLALLQGSCDCDIAKIRMTRLNCRNVLVEFLQSCTCPKFMGSEDVFVCTTDAYHMLRTTKRAVDAFTIAYYVNNARTEKVSKGKRWKKTVKDFLIVTAIRCVGFSLTYSLIFKPQSASFFDIKH